MELQSERLLIREIVDEDLLDFYEIYSNPNVTTSSGFYPIGTYSQGSDYINLFKGTSNFGVILKSENKLIGVIGYENDDEIIISYLLNQSYWGNGYATEALNLLLQYMKKLGYNHILADCFIDNLASEKVLKKCGFQYLNNYNRIYSSLNNEEKTCKLFQINNTNSL
ncbi:MAG: GNAT family N-acetyltransferase [Oscillospiraceae bacterium]